MLVVKTEYFENYGTFCMPDWRAKGDVEYKLPWFQGGKLVAKDLIHNIRYQLEYQGNLSWERVSSWYISTDSRYTDNELDELQLYGEVLSPAEELPQELVKQWYENSPAIPNNYSIAD